MPRKPFIGFEIHDASLWEPSFVLGLLPTMERWGYTALVLHQNTLLDVCTQLEMSANYGLGDLRLKKVRNNAAWLNQLVRRLQAFDADLFLEIKEPSYEDYVLESMPGLLGPQGQPDPTSPDWPILLRQKVEDLLHRVPGIGGLIVNLSSPESRVSLPDYLATNNAPMDRTAWFARMIAALWEPLSAAGKQLFIRDFSYTADMQSDVLTAVQQYGGAVGSSIKITAHDYFPEAPENPALRTAPDPAIVEVEAFGEHTGWGVIPNCRVAELRDRMISARGTGVHGILVRTSWEAISGANAMASLSACNVYAMPRLLEQDAEPTGLVIDWLSEAYGVTGDPARRAAELLLRSWHIPAAAYWAGEVFPRHSCLPSTWREGWLSMETTGMGNRGRHIAIRPDDARLSERAKSRLFADTQAAVELAETLAQEAAALMPELPPELAQHVRPFSWLPAFARQFDLAIRATFHAARATPDDLAALPPLRDALQGLAEEFGQRLARAEDLPRHHHVLFDPEQIRRFEASLPR